MEILFVVVLVAVSAGVWWYTEKQKTQKRFDDAVLRVLYNRLSPDTSKKLYRELMDCGDQGMEVYQLVRSVQIMSESMGIALKSKKREVAEDRMNSAKEHWSKVQDEFRPLMSPEVFEEVRNFYDARKKVFQTQLYANLVEVALTKAQSMKTKKSRLKYLDQADELLSEATDHPACDETLLAKQFEILDILRQREAVEA
jgi:hypothetical protein